MVSTLMDLGIPDNIILKKLQEKVSLTQEEVLIYLK